MGRHSFPRHVANRFPDQDVQPEFNSVDASLYIIAVNDYLLAGKKQPTLVELAHKELRAAIEAILPVTMKAPLRHSRRSGWIALSR